MTKAGRCAFVLRARRGFTLAWRVWRLQSGLETIAPIPVILAMWPITRPGDARRRRVFVGPSCSEDTLRLCDAAAGDADLS